MPRSLRPLRARVTGAHGGLVLALLLSSSAALGWNPRSALLDPLVRMPGSQPTQGVSIANNTGCQACHGGYNPSVEPMFAFRGSMMAQAARDFLFWPAMTVAAQDSIWAVGRPNATDLCERCHLPKGWLEFRSEPTNASNMTGDDFDGVACDVCHRMMDPFFEDSLAGLREGAATPGYWDETNLSLTPSTTALDTTRQEDELESMAFQYFNGTSLFDDGHRPASQGYTENASGQYYVTSGSRRRASFADAVAAHPTGYSRYHKSKYFCGTCHDVSNTVLANLPFAETTPGDAATVLPSESGPSHGYFHGERTFSEFMLSAYGQDGGAPGEGPFAPAVFGTSQPGDLIATCQDCHMPDVSGKGCGLLGGVDRPSGSVEHPASGQPLHDLTGGNAFVPYVLASTVPGSPNYDAANAAMLGQGAAALTLDLAAGQGLDAYALLAGQKRALASLSRAASVKVVSYDGASGALLFRVVNQTGHKLISGYPEGRRMFVNVRAYEHGNLVYEVNPYDAAIGTLKGMDPAESPDSPALGPAEARMTELVYEVEMQSALTGEARSFHFVLGTERSKDNRIPPKGFRIQDAAARLADPVWLGAAAPDYFTAAEYAGGYDETAMTVPAGADAVEVRLYYQTTSLEYVRFLEREINGTGATLASPTPSGEASAYVAQTDPFFARLAAWGTTIADLWTHNKDVPGAAPILMAQAAASAEHACLGVANGEACSDADACTAGDTCQNGACQSGALQGCDDGNPCTSDGCDPAVGCTHAFVTGPCEDGDLCTKLEQCAFGVCVPGGNVFCGDGDACTTDTCAPATGCVSTPIQGCSGAGGGGGLGGAGGGKGGEGGEGDGGQGGGAGGSTASSGGAAGAGGSSTSGGASVPPAGGSDEGCGCRAGGAEGGAGAPAGWLVGLGLFAAIRRRLAARGRTRSQASVG